MANLFKRGKSWYVEYDVHETVEGERKRKRKRISLRKRGITTHKEAKNYFAALENDIRNQGLRSVGIRITSDVTVSNAVHEYLEKCSLPYKTPSTLNLDRIVLGKHFVGEFSECYVNKLTKADVEKYIKKRRRSVKAVTVNREIDLMKSFFAQCVEWEYTPSNPAEKIRKFKIEKNEPEILSAKEQKRLIEKSDGQTKLAVLLGLYTGMRKGEILSLRWEDIDLRKKIITVRCKEGFMTKTKEFRVIPINGVLLESLKKYPQRGKSGYIFTSDRESRKGHVYDLRTGFLRALKGAGIKRRFRFHDLRHTFISNLIMKGVDILTVSRLSGHKSTRMIDSVYGHLRADHLRKAIERL